MKRIHQFEGFLDLSLPMYGNGLGKGREVKLISVFRMLWDPKMKGNVEARRDDDNNHNNKKND